jgi:hypothetical protein
MAINDIVIEFSEGGAMPFGSNSIQLYKDGTVKIKVNDGHKDQDKTTSMHPKHVEGYARRLVRAGFFGFEDNYSEMVMDGSTEALTLNYGGRNKKVTCTHKFPPSEEYFNIRKELFELIASNTK